MFLQHCHDVIHLYKTVELYKQYVIKYESMWRVVEVKVQEAANLANKRVELRTVR